MIKRRRFPRIFFGWWIVLVAGFTVFWGHGYKQHGISALFKPIASELGFSRAVTSLAASVSRFEGGLEAPLAGWITDKFGPKLIVLFGVFALGLGLILMNFINSLWAFLVVWGLLVGTGGNILATPMQTAIANWFVKKRGLALGVRLMFDRLGGAVVLPLIAWLIITQGWRMACVIGGVVMWLIGLPLVWFFLKPHRPEYYGLLPDGAASEETVADSSRMIEKGVKYAAETQEVEFTLRQTMRTPAFWLIMVTSAVNGLVAPVMSIHCIPFLTDRGIDPLRAAGMMAIISVAAAPSQLIFGAIVDRVGIGRLKFLLAGAYLLQAISLGVFLLHQTTAMIYVWFVLYGIGSGASIATLNPMRGRYFGRKAFGSISGASQLLITPIGVIAPAYVGWLYDTSGSYMFAFTLFLVMLIVAAILMFFVRPPKPPAQITDIHKIL